jgi:hypothetical protein
MRSQQLDTSQKRREILPIGVVESVEFVDLSKAGLCMRSLWFIELIWSERRQTDKSIYLSAYVGKCVVYGKSCGRGRVGRIGCAWVASGLWGSNLMHNCRSNRMHKLYLMVSSAKKNYGPVCPCIRVFLWGSAPANETPQCQFPIFCCFCVSEKLHKKYSRNWTKQKPNLLFFQNTSRSPNQRWRGARTWPHPRAAQARPWLRHQGWASLVHLLTPPIRLYIPLDGKNLSPDQFSTKPTASRRCHRGEIWRVQKLFLAPSGEGNHHQRPSSSPWSPPEWCVSSLPWTTDP